MVFCFISVQDSDRAGLRGPRMCALLAVSPLSHRRAPGAMASFALPGKSRGEGNSVELRKPCPRPWLPAQSWLAGLVHRGLAPRWQSAKPASPALGSVLALLRGAPQPWPEGGLPLSVPAVGGDGGLIHLSPLPRGHVHWSVWQRDAGGETTVVCSPHSALAQVRHGERPVHANHAAGFSLVKFI